MATFRCAVHQSTWKRDLEKDLEDIGAWGYPGTETFSYVVQKFAGREAEFKAMLDARGLQLAALYSDDNGYEPGSEAETIERNLGIARFFKSSAPTSWSTAPADRDPTRRCRSTSKWSPTRSTRSPVPATTWASPPPSTRTGRR